METKKVKIVKATISSYWYADKIGQVFDVSQYENTKNYYCLINGIKHVIDWNDCLDIPYDYVSTTTAIDPKHYKLPIEPKDFIIKNQLGFCEGNVIKYICRYKEKNGVEDLKKAKQYIDFLIDEYETKSNR
jgi:hypothetical protein